MATQFPITGRHKLFEQFFAQPDDFGRGPGAPVASRRVLDEPGWSAYALDPARREVVFVHTPAEIDILAAPFYIIPQYRHADAVLTMSFEEAHGLAAGLPDPRVVLVLSMGRAGTTLLNHALNAAGSVASLSEPGVVEHRQIRDLAAREDVAPLLRDLCRLLFAAHRSAGIDTLAIKFRSQGLFVAEHFWRALPEARYVFQYRDAISWGNSFLQFTADVGLPLPMDEAARATHWMMISGDMPLDVLGRYVDLDELPANNGRMFAPAWTVHMQAYLRLFELGVPFFALRYNELVSDRQAQLERLFTHCGLPLAGIAGALTAFEKDSQEGTAIARKEDKRKFTADELVAYRQTLAKEPALADPDHILPDIYSG